MEQERDTKHIAGPDAVRFVVYDARGNGNVPLILEIHEDTDGEEIF